MRKLISGLLVVLMLITATACDPESGTAGNDVTFGATLSVNKAKEITGEEDDDVAYITTWKYTAVKSDDGYTTGETKEETDLKDGDLTLSLGNWTITVNGYDSKDTLIFTGTTEKPEQIVSEGKQIVVNVEPVKDVEATFYSDFAAAVKAAKAYDTITLVKDVKLTSGSGVLIDKDLTLNGNNHKVYAETWSGTTPLIQLGGNGETTSSCKIALKDLDVKITGDVTSSSGSRVRLVNICNIGKSGDSSYDSNSSLTLTNVNMEIAATENNKKNGTYLYGIFIDKVHGDIVLDNSSVKLPHYYAVYINAGCDNSKMTINKSRLEGWATIYNHSSNFTLESDSSEYVSNNPTSGGGYANSFSSVIVAEYYNQSTEIGESKNNTMTFNGCTFTVTKTYDSANVTQVIANVRSPMGNKVYFNKCTLNPVGNKEYIKVCADHVESGTSKIADKDKGTSRVYIDNVDVTADKNVSWWYVYNKNTDGETYYNPSN